MNALRYRRRYLRRLLPALVALAALALAASGCDSGYSTGTSRPPSALELAARETAQVQETRRALDDEARGTAEALANDAQATRQVMDAQQTAQAQAIQATRAAWELSETQTAVAAFKTATTEAAWATATRQVIAATATAGQIQATATAEQKIADLQDTQVAATANAIAREDAGAQATHLVKTWAGWALLVLSIAALIVVGYQMLPILKSKIGKIARDERGDFPLVPVTQGKAVFWINPALGWGPVLKFLDGIASQPLLTEPEYQDGVARRSQFVDWKKGGRPRTVIINQVPGRHSPALPPPQAGQWRDVTDGQPLPQLPKNVPLNSLLGSGPPSTRQLAMGVTMHQDGRAEIVRADIADLVHVAVGGSSGWGKSVFLRAMAYQLARSSEPVDLALVDLEGVTFAPFARCERLLYPVADTERAALAIFQALTQEMDRRRELYNQFPGADSLVAYNMQTNDPLTPTVCLVDEATVLLQDGGVESAIRTLILRARKYGLWLFLGGQSWKASVLDTTIRDQLATRVQFKAMSASQSRVLLERSGAEEIDVPGRALAILPGRDLIEMQAPYISHHAIAGALPEGGPRHQLPEATPEAAPDTARIRELLQRGLSKRQVALEIFGYVGGAAYQTVTDVARTLHDS
jgi:hypothetical protein